PRCEAPGGRLAQRRDRRDRRVPVGPVPPRRARWPPEPEALPLGRAGRAPRGQGPRVRLAAPVPGGPGRPAGAAAVGAARMSRPDPDTVRLLFGPYRPPKLRRGDRVACLFRDCAVVVTSLAETRLGPWPRCRRPDTGGGGSGLLVDGE